VVPAAPPAAAAPHRDGTHPRSATYAPGLL